MFYWLLTMKPNKCYINFTPKYTDRLKINALTMKTLFRLQNDSIFKIEQLHNHIYVDNTLIDNLEFNARFSIIYILLQQKMKINKILNFGLRTKFNVISQTVSNIFYGIGAAEREIYDLFGVSFKNHPDLRRVVTDYGFKGNPLKKDFPLTGTIEVFYSVIKKILIFKPIKLVQEMRVFSYDTPWITNNDFYTDSKTEQEDDLEMGIVIKKE